MDTTQIEHILSQALAPGAHRYALLDAAAEPSGPYEARRAGLEHDSLFSGELGKRLEDVAPYLIRFPVDSPFQNWWFEQWGASIGVLVDTPERFSTLWRHFRTLTLVRGQDQQRYYFRFYDPRVLRVFLPACTVDELRSFFGPVTVFHCEGPGGTELLSFSLDKDGLVTKRQPVAAGAEPVAARA